MTMYGADVAELRSLGAQFDRIAEQLDANRMSVGNAIQISAWVGPFATQFRIQWNSEHSLRIHSAAQLLRAGAQTLRANADDQDRASAAATGTLSHTWPGAKAVHEKGPESTADFVRGVAEMQNGVDGGDGVRIQKVLGEDGKYRYVVYISGSGSTKDGAWFGDLGWDNNATSMAGVDGATLAHIRAKIASAISDPDAEVMIVGFSQGGMIAQQLADSGAFKTKTVLTYGSPILAEDHNFGGADIIRLEHTGDPVPALGLFGIAARIGKPLGQALAGDEAPAMGAHAEYMAGAPKIDSHNTADYVWVADEFDKNTDPKYDRVKASMARFRGTVVADEK